MGMYMGGKTVALYKGDKHPAELYIGGRENVHYEGKNLLNIRRTKNLGDTGVVLPDWMGKPGRMDENAYSDFNNYRPVTATFYENGFIVGNPGANANGAALQLPVRLGEGVYTLSYVTDSTNNAVCYFYFFDEDGGYLYHTTTRSRDVFTFKAPENTAWVLIGFTGQIETELHFDNVQLEAGEQATAYEPYCGGREVHTGKIAGYRVEEQQGQELLFADTYNHHVDQVTVIGSSVQESSPEDAKEECHAQRFSYETVMDESGDIHSGYDAVKLNGTICQEKSDERSQAEEGVSFFAFSVGEAGTPCCIDRLVLHGQTKQDSYVGKNLLNCLNVSNDFSTVGMPHNSSFYEAEENKISDIRGSYSHYYCIKVGTLVGKHTLSFHYDANGYDEGSYYIGMSTLSTRKFACSLQVEKSGDYSTGSENFSFEDGDWYILIRGSNGKGRGILTNIMLEAGDKSSFEPYVGGPAPNPEYPQALMPLSAVASFHGKNLLSPSFLESLLDFDSYDLLGSYNAKKLVLKPNTSYYLYIHNEYDKSALGSAQNFVNVFVGTPAKDYYNTNANGQATLFGSVGEKRVVLKTDETGIITFKTVGYASVEYLREAFSKLEIQIEEGSTFTGYESPQEKVDTTPVSLYGTAEVTDTYEPSVRISGTKKSRVTKRWRKIVLTGDEHFYGHPNGYFDKDDAIDRYIGLSEPYLALTNDANPTAFCSHLRYSTSSIWNTPGCKNTFTLNLGTQIHLNIGAELIGAEVGMDSIDAITEKFAAFVRGKYENGTPITIVYPLQAEEVVLGDPDDVAALTPTTIIESNGLMDVTLTVPASPSPKWPRSIDGTTNLDMTIRGENLLDFPAYHEQKTYVFSPSESTKASLRALKPGVQYYSSAEYTHADSYNNTMSGAFFCRTEKGTLVWIAFGTQEQPRMLPILDSPIVDIINLYCDDATAGVAKLENAMIAESREALETYLPFQQQKKQWDIELYGDGTVCDTFEPDVIVDGVHRSRITRWWKKLVLHGTEAYGFYGYRGRNGVYSVDHLMPQNLSRAKGYCTHTSQVGEYYGETGQYIWMGVSSDTFFWVGIADELGIDKTSQFNDWLMEQEAAGTPVTIVYQLETPESELGEPQPMDTFYPVTILESDAPMDISVRTPAKPSPEWESPVIPVESPTVSTAGKNLFDEQAVIERLYSNTWEGRNETSYRYFTLHLKPNTQYTIWCAGERVRAANTILHIGFSPEQNYGLTTSMSPEWASRCTGVTDDEGTIYVKTPYGGEWEKTVLPAKVMIEEGDHPTSYVPYVKPAEATLPVKLHGIGDLKDTVEMNALSGCDFHAVVSPDLPNFAGVSAWNMTSGWGGHKTVAMYFYCGLSNGMFVVWPDGVEGTLRSNMPGLYGTGYNVDYEGINVGMSGTGKYTAIRIWRYRLYELGWDGESDPMAYCREWLRRNPVHIYYRTADYTVDKDIPVNKVMRQFYEYPVCGREDMLGTQGYYDRPNGADRYVRFPVPILSNNQDASLCNRLHRSFGNWADDSLASVNSYCINARTQLHLKFSWNLLDGVEYDPEDENYGTVTEKIRELLWEWFRAGEALKVIAALETPKVEYYPAETVLPTYYPMTRMSCDAEMKATVKVVDN